MHHWNKSLGGNVRRWLSSPILEKIGYHYTGALLRRIDRNTSSGWLQMSCRHVGTSPSAAIVPSRMAYLATYIYDQCSRKVGRSATHWLHCSWRVRLLTVITLCTLLLFHGPLARYVQLRVAHAPGMPGTFSPRVSYPDMHHGTCVTHVPWCMAGSLTSGFLWSRWRGKCSRHSRRMRNPQFYGSCKRPIAASTSNINTEWLPVDFNVITTVALFVPFIGMSL